MSNNSYNDFKNGIKSDIKETGASLFLVGGLMLLGCVLFTVLVVAIKSTKIDSSTRFILGGGAIMITALLIFSKSIRTRIAQIWLISLVAIPILFLLFIVGCLFYILFTQLID